MIFLSLQKIYKLRKYKNMQVNQMVKKYKIILITDLNLYI